MTSIFNSNEPGKGQNPKFGWISDHLKSFLITGASILVGFFALFYLFVYLESTEMVVVQYPWGELKTHVEPGIYPRFFGTVRKYPLSSQFSFSSQFDQGDSRDESLRLRRRAEVHQKHPDARHIAMGEGRLGQVAGHGGYRRVAQAQTARRQSGSIDRLRPAASTGWQTTPTPRHDRAVRSSRLTLPTARSTTAVPSHRRWGSRARRPCA